MKRRHIWFWAPGVALLSILSSGCLLMPPVSAPIPQWSGYYFVGTAHPTAVIGDDGQPYQTVEFRMAQAGPACDQCAFPSGAAALGATVARRAPGASAGDPIDAEHPLVVMLLDEHGRAYDAASFPLIGVRLCIKGTVIWHRRAPFLADTGQRVIWEDEARVISVNARHVDCLQVKTMRVLQEGE
jgi:hypothetical protein